MSVGVRTGRNSWRDFSLGFAALAIILFFAWREPAFISSRNLSNLGVEFAITGVLALGVFLVLLPGHTDLSSGSGVGLIGGLATVLIIQHGLPAPVAMGLALAVALALWSAMGFLVVSQRLPAFIITLAGLLVFRGLQWRIIHSTTIPVTVGAQDNLLSVLTTWYLPPPLALGLVAMVSLGLGIMAWRRFQRRRNWGLLDDGDLVFVQWLVSCQLLLVIVLVLNRFHGLPLPVIILGVVAAAVSTLTRHTPFGRHLYAIGGNAAAARLSGINVQRSVVIAFALCGAVVALTGFMQTAYTGATTTTVGTLMELDAIAACVIGGVSLSGGAGSVGGVLFGALIMATLLNGMTLMAVPLETKYIARGVVLAAAVWMDKALSRRAG